VRVLIIYVSVGVLVFPPESVVVRDIVLVVTGEIVCESVVEEVLETDAEAEMVEVRRGLAVFITVLDWLTELVAVLDDEGDLVLVFDVVGDLDGRALFVIVVDPVVVFDCTALLENIRLDVCDMVCVADEQELCDPVILFFIDLDTVSVPLLVADEESDALTVCDHVIYPLREIIGVTEPDLDTKLVALTVRVANIVLLGFNVRDDVTLELDVFEGLIDKVGLRVDLIVRVIYELDVGVLVGHLDDDRELDDDPVLLEVIVLVPVTDAVPDLVLAAVLLGVSVVKGVLEGSGLLDTDGLPVEVLEGLMVADVNGLALVVFDICVE
jgi:hypothetical protein